MDWSVGARQRETGQTHVCLWTPSIALRQRVWKQKEACSLSSVWEQRARCTRQCVRRALRHKKGDNRPRAHGWAYHVLRIELARNELREEGVCVSCGAEQRQQRTAHVVSEKILGFCGSGKEKGNGT